MKYYLCSLVCRARPSLTHSQKRWVRVDRLNFLQHVQSSTTVNKKLWCVFSVYIHVINIVLHCVHTSIACSITLQWWVSHEVWETGITISMTSLISHGGMGNGNQAQKIVLAFHDHETKHKPYDLSWWYFSSLGAFWAHWCSPPWSITDYWLDQWPCHLPSPCLPLTLRQWPGTIPRLCLHNLNSPGAGSLL